MGIEPTYPAWKAGVLPLNYTRIIANIEILAQHDFCVKNNLKHFEKDYYKIQPPKIGGCIDNINIVFPKGRGVLQACHRQRTCRHYVRDLPICNVISCHEFLSF